jgi:3',5'-cyclic AMP phosphodiesterase CpdA
VPLLAIQSVFPSLDGPRDLVTAFTQRPRGGGELEVLAALERALPADLVVSTGDLVQDGRRGVQWEDFVRHHAALRAAVSYAAAPGNHEVVQDSIAGSNWDAVMGPPSAPGRYWYALDVGEARFVFLDSNVFTDPHDVYPAEVEAALADEQLAWTDSVLAQPASHRFLVFHHPLVGTGHYLEDWASPAAASRRERLLAMCFARGVTAVFAGHEHLYDRGYLRAADGGSGVWQIVTGGGGSPLYPVDPERRALARAGVATVTEGTEVVKTAYHYVRLVVPSAGPPRVTVTEVQGSSETPLDAFDLAPPSGRP